VSTALPLAWGLPPARGRTRVELEDFEVDELLGFRPDGTGSHLLLLVEKRGANTGWVASELARAAGIASREVGFSGHKDRAAVARQHYTLPASAVVPGAGWTGFEGEGFRVLEVCPHGRKLRIGSHRSNRFRIRIRDLEGDADAISRRIEAIARGGVPNYFGPQRFGRGGANLALARHWADGGPPPRDRRARGFALSAARGELFNTLLAHRVERGDWRRLLPGDVAMLDGARSWFPIAAVDETLIARCEALDLHPTGPLHGRGESSAAAAVAVLEREVVQSEPGLVALLESQGLAQERRSLRLPVRALTWCITDVGLTLTFELPRGAFATAVLHELLADAWDEHERGED
jgi:tRNA pseudouridine13 synthase